MEALGFTIVDFVVIGILVFAGLMGLSSGLIHSVLFMGAWGAAAWAAWRLRESFQPEVEKYVADQSIAYFATLLGIFVVALIVLTILAGLIGGTVRKSTFSGVDKALGFGFGVLCGGLVLSTAFLAFVYVYKQGPLLETIEKARTYPVLRDGANLIEPYLPPQFRSKPPQQGGALPPDMAPAAAPTAAPAPTRR